MQKESFLSDFLFLGRMTIPIDDMVFSELDEPFDEIIPHWDYVATCDEIQSALTKKPEHREKLFFPGNAALHGIENGRVFLYLTDYSNNPLMKDPEGSVEVFRRGESVVIDPEAASEIRRRAESGEGITRIDITDIIFSEQPYQGQGKISVSRLALRSGKDMFHATYPNQVVALFEALHGDALYGTDGIGSKGIVHDSLTTPILVRQILVMMVDAMKLHM